MENSKVLKSGEFLVDEVRAEDIFIPEQFDEEQKMIAQTIQDFLETELYPVIDKIDAPDTVLMKSTLQKAGELVRDTNACCRNDRGGVLLLRGLHGPYRYRNAAHHVLR
jgi:hypothetical protein